MRDEYTFRPGDFVRAGPGQAVEVDSDGTVRWWRPLLGWLAVLDGDGVRAELVCLAADGQSLVSPERPPGATVRVVAA